MADAKMTPPFASLTEVKACDADGVNEYPAWVNSAQVVAVKFHNAGNGLSIMEVLTTAGTFYIKDPNVVARRERETETSRPATD